MTKVWDLEAGLRDDYERLVRSIARQGRQVAPRGEPTREVLNGILSLPSAYHGTFPWKIGRGVSSRVLAAEMLQWLGGVSDLAQLQGVSSVFAKFSDDGERLHGAYGPRTYRGLKRIVRLLDVDHDSRQATVSLWRDEPDRTLDLPCTVSWSFVIRNERLHMTTFMRSNDVWTGTAYDVPIMCRLQTMLAWALRVGVGTYTHHAQSLHIYDRDLAGVESLSDPDDVEEPPFLDSLPDLPGSAIDRWDWAVAAADAASRGQKELPDVLEWYASRLRDGPRNEHFCPLCRYYLRQPELICSGG